MECNVSAMDRADTGATREVESRFATMCQGGGVMSKRMREGALLLGLTSMVGALASATPPASPDARDNAPPMKSVLGLAFAPDGRSLASVGETLKSDWNVPGTLRVWDVDAR